MSEERDLRPEIERLKERKDGLDVIDDLVRAARDGGIAALDPDDLALAKWWGIYPQKPEEDGYLMLRVRVSNGLLDSRQLRAIADLSIRYGRSLADVTTRQCIQLHWLRLEDVPDIFATLDEVGLTSAQACGDVWRNVVGCPLAGVTADEYFDSTPVVHELVETFVGNRRFSNLPRKYKVAVSSCRHHCAQHEINDIGLVGVDAPDLGPGYDLWVGGGLGASARMGRRLGAWIPGDDAVEVAGEITALFRDHGNRLKRTRARSKFLVDEWGPERFRQALEERLGRELEDGPPPAPPLAPMRDHVGYSPQREPGLYALGGATLRGRITGENLRALADVAERRGQGRIRLTNRQNVILLDIPEAVREETAAEMADATVPVHATSFRRQVISCTGIEFCRLAVSETKQVAEGIIEHLESHLGDLDPAVRINVNGCPNACAQYQVADIGLQGALAKRDGAKVMGFQLHLGGRLGEDRAFGRRTARPIPAEERPSCWSASSSPSATSAAPTRRSAPGSTARSPTAWRRWSARRSSRSEPETPPYRHRAPRRALVGPPGWRRAWTIRRCASSRSRAIRRCTRPPGSPAPSGSTPGRSRAPATAATCWPPSAPRRTTSSCSTATARTATPRSPTGSWRRPATPACACSTAAVAAGSARAGRSRRATRRCRGLRVPRRLPDWPTRAADDVLLDVAETEAGATVADAARVPWEQAVSEDGSFRELLDLRKLFEDAGVLPARHVALAAPSRPEAALAWFVLHELLDYPDVADAVDVACATEAER